MTFRSERAYVLLDRRDGGDGLDWHRLTAAVLNNHRITPPAADVDGSPVLELEPASGVDHVVTAAPVRDGEHLAEASDRVRVGLDVEGADVGVEGSENGRSALVAAADLESSAGAVFGDAAGGDEVLSDPVSEG